MVQAATDMDDRRQHDRIARPQLYVRVGEHIFKTAEWTYGGMLVEDQDRILPAGTLLRIDGLADEKTYKKAKKPNPVDIRARVIRTIPEARLAALTCLKMDDAAYRVLSQIEND